MSDNDGKSKEQKQDAESQGVVKDMESCKGPMRVMTPDKRLTGVNRNGVGSGTHLDIAR